MEENGEGLKLKLRIGTNNSQLSGVVKVQHFKRIFDNIIDGCVYNCKPRFFLACSTVNSFLV